MLREQLKKLHKKVRRETKINIGKLAKSLEPFFPRKSIQI